MSVPAEDRNKVMQLRAALTRGCRARRSHPALVLRGAPPFVPPPTAAGGREQKVGTDGGEEEADGDRNRGDGAYPPGRSSFISPGRMREKR